MSTDPWPGGVGRLVFETLDSTNAEAARRAATLDTPTWILARRQTGGRGRRGRAWSDPPGNFAATFVRPITVLDAAAALRSFVAALALHDALAPLASPGTLALKWPNDVLLDGGKLAGVLLETGGADRTGGYLAVGIGVNLIDAPRADEGRVQPVSLAAKTGRHLSAEALLDRLARAYARREATFEADGFEPLRRGWLDRAAGVGCPVTARTMRDTVEGRFETVDESGAIVLDTSAGRRAIPAAEVFF